MVIETSMNLEYRHETLIAGLRVLARIIARRVTSKNPSLCNIKDDDPGDTHKSANNTDGNMTPG